jgi:sarcosine oxidase subunit alpha
MDKRIYEHPILTFKRGKKLEFSLDGRSMEGFDNETVAAALHANGIKVLSTSPRYRRPRGFFCGIGKCSSCLMEVDSFPNDRTCTLPLKPGMRVRTQHGRGKVRKAEGAEKMERKTTDLLVVGSGPAGLSAASEATNMGFKVLLVDESPLIGGQLIKQTHRFFGSEREYAGTRGIDIPQALLGQCRKENLEIETQASMIGFYPEGAVVERRDRMELINARKTLITCGAQENLLIFENNDLPGVYGAGGVQTLMNVYGVKPGEKAIMVGSGNVGLIVAYQLLQAGVEVEALIEIMDHVGGYQVHAAKLLRQGVPILLRHTVIEATGRDCVEGAVVKNLETGDTRKFSVDLICIAVGLSPSVQLLKQAGCSSAYIPELGGEVVLHDEDYRTGVKDIFVAGDSAAVEEASSAMIEGRIAAISALLELEDNARADERRRELRSELAELRNYDVGERIIRGEQKLLEAYHAEA